jgi:hypothetical protein
MHALRFGSMLKNRARHSVMQERRFASHSVCAAVWVDPTATKPRMTEVKSRSKPAEWRISC